MCGRYAIFGPVSRKNREAIEFMERELQFGPAYNAAPTQRLPVYSVAPDGGRSLRLMRWGLIPSWAKDATMGAKLINARAETVAGKPAFRSAFARRRCLVPMAGFYEWARGGPRKVPHFIYLLNADLFAVAGIHEFWPGAGGAEPVESYAVLTTDANELMRNIHDRMPVILHAADYGAWLDPSNTDSAALTNLLKPFPSEEMRAYPVSTRVNSARNDGPELIAPARDEKDEG